MSPNLSQMILLLLFCQHLKKKLIVFLKITIKNSLISYDIPLHPLYIYIYIKKL